MRTLRWLLAFLLLALPAEAQLQHWPLTPAGYIDGERAGLPREQIAQVWGTAVPTAGGLALSSAIAANTTNATSVKATFGQVYAIDVSNNSANLAYLKLYDKASAPTCGTDTPVARFLVPATAAGGRIQVSISAGLAFGTGIGYCLTGAIADNDTTAVAASAYIVQIGYK